LLEDFDGIGAVPAASTDNARSAELLIFRWIVGDTIRMRSGYRLMRRIKRRDGTYVKIVSR